MSRLLTALKRLDESGANRSPEPRSSDGRTDGRAHAQTPTASPSAKSSQRSTPIASVSTESAIDRWPGGVHSSAVPSVAEIIPLAPADPTTAPNSTDAIDPSHAAAYRGTRSTSPGRRAADGYRVAPQYAALCQAILQRVARTRPTSILIVPAAADVDTGAVAAELALSMAHAVDLPIVAIDADMMSESDDTDSAVTTSGLTDVLFDRVDWRGVLAPARDNRVQLLAAGRPLSAAERSGGESLASAATRLGPMVSEIKTRYRYLIVHAGPSNNPLTGALVQASDLIYLALRLGQTTRSEARAAKRTLQRGGAIVHGSILLANSAAAANS